VDVYLTDREAEVMDVLWKAGPSLVAEVREQLPEEFAYTTVLTVLRTLETKGYVDHSTEGRGHRYFAKVEQRVARRSALQHLTQKLFDGSRELLLTHLVSEKRLTADEIKRLRQLLDESTKAKAK
jgi:BlaI family transcriptional regulator, penicillinase repressor